MQNESAPDERSERAEGMPDFGPDNEILSGTESRAALAECLECHS